MQIWSSRNQNFTLQELWSNQIIQNNNNTKQKKKNFSIFSVIEVAKTVSWWSSSPRVQLRDREFFLSSNKEFE